MAFIGGLPFGDFMMRIAAMLSIAFALVLLSAPVDAGQVKVGNVAVQLSPPSGYCDMDKAFDYDKTLDANTAKLAEGAGNSYFGLFLDCQGLKKARQTKEFIPTKIIVQGTKLGVADLKNIQATCDELKTLKISDQQKDMQDNVKKNSGGNSLGEQSGLGVLDEVKDEVCYYGLIQNVVASGKNVRLLTIFASALRKHSIFFIYDVQPLDSTSVAATLAHLKSVYADFAKANPD
jgi:hypothetical protein